MDLFLASTSNMKWLRKIKKKTNAGKKQIYVFRGLWVKKFALKSEALTGGVLHNTFNNFANFTVKHLR